MQPQLVALDENQRWSKPSSKIHEKGTMLFKFNTSSSLVVNSITLVGHQLKWLTFESPCYIENEDL